MLLKKNKELLKHELQSEMNDKLTKLHEEKT